MNDTREKILFSALDLFSKKGYDAVSVRDIASTLGISQSALYKHYLNKRDILESIISRMELNDRDRAISSGVPEGRVDQMQWAYKSASVETVARYSYGQFLYWTQDPFASRFRMMLTIERYKSPRMTALFQQYLLGGVLEYISDLFREMPIETGDAELLALRFYSPIFTAMHAPEPGSRANAELVKHHIDDFVKSISAKP